MAKKKVAKKKKAVGRPTKYKPANVAKVEEYIKSCLTLEEGKEREIPTRAGLSMLFNVSLATIDTWGKMHPEFLVALGRVKMSQQQQLINRCLNGTGNSTIGKMLLSANHGLHERNETEHDVSDDLADLMKEIGGKSAGLPIKVVG
jgi:hypothetical protein